MKFPTLYAPMFNVCCRPMVCIQCEKTLRICNRLGTIPACDRQTDGHTCRGVFYGPLLFLVSVSHPKLLHKLKSYGIDGILLDWVAIFCLDAHRRHQISIIYRSTGSLG